MKNIKIITGNLLDAPKDRILCHQVNCQNVMGSGVAKAIYTKYPIVKKEYHDLCDCAIKPDILLGRIQVINTGEHYVVNMFSQLRYGYDGQLYSSYEAFIECLQQVRKYFFNDTIAMPYKIGCDRGGGDWNIVYDIISCELNKVNVELYKLGD